MALADEILETEVERVTAWRLWLLLADGFTFSIAEAIAHSDADYRQAIEMHRQGCEPATILRILG